MATATDTQIARTGADPIGAWGNAGRGFAHPVDMSTDPATGRLLVINRSTSWNSPHGRAVRVSVLDSADSDADVVFEFGHYGADRGQLMAPVAIAATGTGLVAITDEHSHTVEVFTSDGAFVRRIGRRGTGPGQFDAPSGIAVDAEGMWVVDSGNDRIQRLTWTGLPTDIIGASGMGPGQFRRPWLLDVDRRGRLWVADWGNDRIQVVTADGACELLLGSPGHAPFRRPSAVVTTHDDSFYVADWGQQRLVVFDGDMQRVDVWHGAATCSAWARQRMSEFPIMAEHRQAAGDPAGERRLGRPGGLCVLPDGDVLVADPAHHRLQRYRRSGDAS